MLDHYRRLLSNPRFRKLSIAAFILRFPNTMISLSIVMVISAKTGSYRLAGAVAGACSLSVVVTNPYLGRLIDRYGQSKIITPAAGIFAIGVTGLVMALEWDAPYWTFFLAAIAMAAGTVPVGPMIRARWSQLFSGSDLLLAAFSWEQVMTEIAYVLGPIVATALIAWKTLAGLITCLILTVIGTAGFAAQRASESNITVTERKPLFLVLRVPGIVVLAAFSIGLGGVFGSNEVAAVAFSDSYSHRSTAAWMLALMATGSTISGIGYGMRRWKMRPHIQLTSVLVVLVVGLGITPLTTSVIQVCVLLLLAGLAVAPAIIAANTLGQTLAPAGAITETLAFTTAGIGLGGAIGSSATGSWIQTYGARYSFFVPMLASIFALAVVIIGLRWLATEPEAEVAVATTVNSSDDFAIPAPTPALDEATGNPVN